jgi:hypothetical protein
MEADMPNFDGGHYFLTVLAPIREDAEYDPATKGVRSHRHLLMQALATMPLSEITDHSADVATPASPFARTDCTHLARFVVIDDPAYNGRQSGDSLLGKIPFWPFSGGDKLVAQPVDRLGASYLLFAADFDAPDGSEASLRRYTDTLWHHMAPEFAALFRHCVGFAGNPGAEDFFHYVRRCQTETTMPFNDYWTGPLPVPNGQRWLVGGLAASVLAAAVAALTLSWALFLPVLALGLYILYRAILAVGARPFPTAPGSDLPTVLKALYLQRQFTRFALDHQDADADRLHAAFGRFLSEHVPVRLDGPATQAPGVIPLAGGGVRP